MQAKPHPDEISRLLRYDPEEGTLFWRTSGRHHKAGDEAGTLTRDGNVWVSIQGRKYPARSLVWVLTRGTWPIRPLVLASDLAPDLTQQERRRARQDLRLYNITDQEKPLSQKPNAVLARARRAQHIALKAGFTFNMAQTGGRDPTRPELHWSPVRNLWTVYDDPQVTRFLPTGSRPPDHREVAIFKDIDTARAFYDAHHKRLDFLCAYLAPPLVPDMKLRMAAGDKYFGVTLWEVHNLLAYNPETGELIWRTPPARIGLLATSPGTTVPALYVSIHGRRYPAHNLAWFMTHGVWPGRKGLGWHNGDQTDNRLVNLYMKDTPQ